MSIEELHSLKINFYSLNTAYEKKAFYRKFISKIFNRISSNRSNSDRINWKRIS